VSVNYEFLEEIKLQKQGSKSNIHADHNLGPKKKANAKKNEESKSVEQ
jgi:hypothetical protein